MKSMFLQSLVAGAAVLFCLSCGSGTDPVIDEATADSDTANSGTEGEAVVTDQDTAKPASKPGDDFFSPQREVTFEFKGIINTYDDVLAQTDTKGVMDMTMRFDGKEFTMNDYPTAFTVTYPEDAPEHLRGKRFVQMGSHGDLKSEGGIVSYYTFIVSFPAEFLSTIKSEGRPQFTFGETGMISSLTFTEYKKRADSSVVLKKCMKGIVIGADSAFFINHAQNSAFEAGENFLTWGNAAITAQFDPAKLTGYEEYKGQWCQFRLDDTAISKEKYEEEYNRDMSKLDCELPAGFLDGAGDNSVTYTFRGKMNMQGSQDNKGFGTFTVKIDGKPVEVSDYIATAGAAISPENQDLIAIESAGGLESINGDKHYKYNYFITVVDKKTLLEAKTAGNSSVLLSDIGDASVAYSQLVAVEQKAVSATSVYQKACYTAIIAPKPDKSAVFYCIAQNETFAVGEEIQAAANVTLTTDKEYMIKLLKLNSADELCSCSTFDGNTGNPIECSVYDDFQP